MRRIVGWMNTLKCERREEWITKNSLSVDAWWDVLSFPPVSRHSWLFVGFLGMAAYKRVLCVTPGMARWTDECS